jgi:methyl-accepting chemotaxis protein
LLKEITIQHRNVRNNTRLVAESLERAAARIDKMENALDKFSNGIQTDFASRQQFVEFTKIMTQLSQASLSNFEELIERMQVIPDLIQVTTESMRDGGNALHHMTQTFTKNIGMADSIESDLASIGDSINNANLGFKALSDSADEHVKIFKKHQNELERLLQESRLSLDALNQHFVKAANYVSSRLGN